MFLMPKFIATFLFGTLINRINSEQCPGYTQEVVIPRDYAKHTPDSFTTGNVTEVRFWFYVKQVDMVNEER